ncbi:hypothetical protein B0H14DRAFT_2556916 [Mycena olivaceomarginata]|nr:hypothetical protein B0H14DRAFT_2556916 [Mycena olivaceomarginata]
MRLHKAACGAPPGTTGAKRKKAASKHVARAKPQAAFALPLYCELGGGLLLRKVWWKKYHKQLVLTTIQCLSTARHGAKARLSNYTGFEMFLLPKLAGLDDEVVYVPLPDFTLQDAQSMVKSLGSLTQPNQDLGRIWWCPSIMNNDAPKVAFDVYAHLFKTSPPDSTKAAEGHHLAVGMLRDSDGAVILPLHGVAYSGTLFGRVHGVTKIWRQRAPRQTIEHRSA